MLEIIARIYGGFGLAAIDHAALACCAGNGLSFVHAWQVWLRLLRAHQVSEMRGIGMLGEVIQLCPGLAASAQQREHGLWQLGHLRQAVIPVLSREIWIANWLSGL